MGGSNPGTEDAPNPPVVDPDRGDRPLPSGVGCVVLAGGTSSRYGAANKLLATVEGTPIVRRAVETVLETGVEGAVVVLGHEAERVRAALADLPVSFVANPDYASGQATSVARGAAAAAERGWRAAVFALGDMPFVRPSSVDALLGAYAADRGGVLAAAYRGERGNPVLFDARYFETLRDVSGDRGGRHLITGPDAALVETGDPGVRRDVDRPGDLPGGDDTDRVDPDGADSDSADPD